MHHHPLAHPRLPIGHCRPQGSYDTAWFVATHHAAFGRRRPIRTQVATAKAAGAHGYDDVARSRHRIRKLLERHPALAQKNEPSHFARQANRTSRLDA